MGNARNNISFWDPEGGGSGSPEAALSKRGSFAVYPYGFQHEVASHADFRCHLSNLKEDLSSDCSGMVPDAYAWKCP